MIAAFADTLLPRPTLPLPLIIIIICLPAHATRYLIFVRAA